MHHTISKTTDFSDRDLAALILPLLLEQLLAITVGLADTMMVATAGEAAVSAVSLIDAIGNLMIYVFSALATGGAVIAGQYIGRREGEHACESGVQLMVLLAASSAVLAALMYLFQDLILTTLFGKVEPLVMENCVVYYSIVTASIPFIALYNGAAALFRTIGRSDISLWASVLMNVLNVAGNAVLIFGFGMGVAGVAIPTLVSRAAAAGVILLLLCSDKHSINLRALRHYRYDGGLIRRILCIAVPSGIENGMFHFGRLILVGLVATFGTASITANAIGNTVGNFHCFVGQAVSLGLATVVSRCVGAHEYEKARYYTRRLVKGCYALMLAVNVLLLLLIPAILHLYNVSDESARLAAAVMAIHGSASIFLWTPAFVICNTLRAAGDARFTMLVSTLTMWILRVAGGYFISVHLGLGIIGVWLAHSVLDWTVRTVLFAARYRGDRWEKIHLLDD